MNGWMEKLLVVDLASGRSLRSRSTWRWRACLSAARPGRAPVVGPRRPRGGAASPENVLIIATGPMTATGFQTSNFSVTTKSPQTGTVLDANSGGTWGMRFKRGLRRADRQGRAPHPVWLRSRRMPSRSGRFAPVGHDCAAGVQALGRTRTSGTCCASARRAKTSSASPRS